MTQSKARQGKGYRDTVTITHYRNHYRLNFDRGLSRIIWGCEQKQLSSGFSIAPENLAKLEEICTRIHLDVLADNFDPTLVKYGLGGKPNLTVVEAIKPKQLSVLEVYDRYVQSREGEVAETTLRLCLGGHYRQAIAKAVSATDSSALAIKEFLLKNSCQTIAKKSLSYLEKAYQLGIEHDYVDKNPFVGMAAKIKLGKGKGKVADSHDDESEESDTRAFTPQEVNAIIEAFESNRYRRHLAPIIKFLFWTGCRTGEAMGLRWRDIKWDKEWIVFKRTYNPRLKIFKKTKTGVARLFPMPKDGQLWQLLKSLPERGLDDVVFPSKTGKIIDGEQLSKAWRGEKSNRQPGVIPELIEQGKVSQYLKLYATRHTFISHQVNIHEIPITTVAQWVGNGAMVANNSYLDRDRLTVPGYSTEAPTHQPVDDSTKQLNELLGALTPEQIDKLKALLADK